MPNRLAEPPHLERHYGDDRDAQLAALRVVLHFPARPVLLEKETP